MKSIQDIKFEQQLAQYREKLADAQKREDKDMGRVIIKCVEALYRSQGREEQIPLPKWITE